MGFFKNILGGSVKATPTPAPVAPAVQEATPAQNEEERRKRILALNSGGNAGQLTPGGGDTSQATTGRKALLGL